MRLDKSVRAAETKNPSVIYCLPRGPVFSYDRPSASTWGQKRTMDTDKRLLEKIA
jgi:hypothetical protein